MGIRQWIEVIESPGVTYQRTITAGAWTEHRTDCYCCSCGDDRISSDIYCRNHGWYGERPCEKHNMPGTAGDDGTMPASVQAELANQKA